MPNTSPKRFEPNARGIVHLRYGDVAYLAERTGKSSSHVGRVIAAPTKRDAAPELVRLLVELLGVPLAKVRMAQRKKAKG